MRSKPVNIGSFRNARATIEIVGILETVERSARQRILDAALKISLSDNEVLSEARREMQRDPDPAA